MRVSIDKLVFGGQGLGRLPTGQVVFVWNALPGEEVEIEVIKRTRTHIEAVAREVLTPSPDRITPKEPDIFLSTSPWQMMSWNAELRSKQEVAAETYQKIGGLSIDANTLAIAANEDLYGYRNKMEFSFATRDDGEISLAFFARGGRSRYAVDESQLAHPLINRVAGHVLEWIRTQTIPLRSLKTLIVRTNGTTCLAGLFLKDELPIATGPALTPELTGVSIFYSTHHSPASVPTKPILTYGNNTIIQTIGAFSFHYGLFSFFQINVPLFTQTLKDIEPWIETARPLLDYYAGVGTIGLSVSSQEQLVTLVDSNTEAVAYAQKNIEANRRTKMTAICGPAEKMPEYINSSTTLIVDPPRAGLHPKLMSHLQEVKPHRIIYLSCGIDTQARDIKQLSDMYELSFLKLYNFFPRTPHIEALCVLEKKF